MATIHHRLPLIFALVVFFNTSSLHFPSLSKYTLFAEALNSYKGGSAVLSARVRAPPPTESTLESLSPAWGNDNGKNEEEEVT
eukprot:8852933-Ditylum_brightwellii.AAC.1